MTGAARPTTAKPTPPATSSRPAPATPSAPPSAAATGFTSFPVAGDARVLHVSSSDGDDRNNGLTPERPFATVDRAKEFLRDGFPDRLLLKAGDTFDGPFGYWGWSGRSAEEPMIVSTYGEGDRPLFLCGDETGILSHTGRGVSHVMFQGFELLSERRVPGSKAFREESARKSPNGIIWNQSGDNVLFEDLKITYFVVNIALQANNGVPKKNDEERRERERQGGHYLRGVTINRCILTNSYSVKSHSQNMYVIGVKDLTVRETVFDHAGWNDAVPGAGRTIFNHNLYFYYTMDAPARLERNIFTRGSSHGVQLRPGGVAEGNFFARNALALLLLDGPSAAIGNVILESNDITPDPDRIRGFGIEAESCESVEIRNNVVARKVGSSLHAPAIYVSEEVDEWREVFDNQNLQATVVDNVVHRWTMSSQLDAIQVRDAVQTQEVRDNIVSESRGQDDTQVTFVNPDAGVETYLKAQGESGGLERFVELAASRPRGEWDVRWTAAGINAHVQQGFKPAPFD